MSLTSQPGPSFRDFFRFGDSYPSSAANAEFYTLGRQAMIAGFKSSGLAPGQLVLVPAFICQSVVQELVASGFNVHFYDVTLDLNVKSEPLFELAARVEARAVLIVHYFGVMHPDSTQLIRELSKQLIVGEDRCHGYCGHGFQLDLKLDSAFAFYSLRKVYPVKSGGVLIKNSAEAPIYSNVNKSNFYFGDLIELLVRGFVSILHSYLKINIYGKYVQRLKNFARFLLGSYLMPAENHKASPPIGPSAFLMSFMHDKSLEHRKRRHAHNLINYYDIRFEQSGIRRPIVFEEGSCPQWYPILVPDAQPLTDFLRDNNVGASRWPWFEMPEVIMNDRALFPSTTLLHERMVLLPLHEQVKIKDAKTIVDLVDDFLDVL